MKQLLLLLLLSCFSGIQLRAEYFVIKDYRVSVSLNEDGTAEFDEVIEVEFSQPRHGIFRFIPLRNTVNGKRVDFIIKDLRVDGFKFSSSKKNNNIVLKIGDADVYVEGRQVYRFHYRVLNPLFFYEDHTEFYWDLLGQSWEVPVEKFSFDVVFPSHVQLTPNDVFGYSGDEGLQGTDLALNVSGSRIEGQSTRVYNPGEGMTIAVNLEPDAFPPMDSVSSFWHKHGLFVPAFLFLVAGLFAKAFARNKRQAIMTEYFPPDGISPSIAGGFVDHSVDNNDVLSLIPHLANKGYLRVEATEEQGFFQKKSKITFYKLKEAGSDLMPFELQFFNALFAYGSTVQLDDLKDKFHMHLTSVKASVHEWIRQQGWYEADQKAFGCVTAVLGLVSLAWGAYAIFAKQNMDGIALGAIGLFLFFLSSRFNKRSPLGNETYRKLEGFRMFVSKAERPVIERLLKDDPLYYDKTMPYALAFGYLKQWNRQFEGLLSQPPSWYSGPMIYSSGMNQSWSTFSNSFPSEINEINSVFSSSPSSSGSGGGGGGGFSGGGGGGGGGGSW